MRIYPAIDLIGGKTVRLEQGRYDKQLSYDIDPVEAAKKWESMGAEFLHIVDLDGAKAGKPMNLAVAEEIVKAANIPVEIGGGYRTIEDIQMALDKGVRRVIVGSKAFEDKSFAKECAETFGDGVIFSVDAKNGQIMSDGWELDSGCDDVGMIEVFVSECGAKEIIYTDIQKDGMLTGPSTGVLENILDKIDIKIISAGGIKTVDHVKELKKIEEKGLSGVIIGRALYDGTIDLKEAIDAG